MEKTKASQDENKRKAYVPAILQVFHYDEDVICDSCTNDCSRVVCIDCTTHSE